MPEQISAEDAGAREAAWQRWCQDDEQSRRFRQTYTAFCAGWDARAADVELLHTVARNMKSHIEILERDKLEIAAELVALKGTPNA